MVPLGADVFSAQDVNGEPTVFAVIDSEEIATEPVRVVRITTGRPFSEDITAMKYIGTFSVANYGIVCHFYVGPKE